MLVTTREFSVMSVCPSVCLSAQAIIFELLHIRTSFWHRGMSWPYLGQVWVSRSLGQGQVKKKDCLLILTCYSFVCGYRSLIRSRSHIKVKVKSWTFLRRDAFTQVVCIWIKCVLVWHSSRCYVIGKRAIGLIDLLLTKLALFLFCNFCFIGGTCFGVMTLIFSEIN